MLVDVLTDQGIQLAKVLSHTGGEYVIQYFLKKKGPRYIYEGRAESVDAECINAQYQDGEEEKTVGFDRYLHGDDSEYEPSESEEDDSDSDSESLVESEEEEA